MHFHEEIERIKSVAADTVFCEWENYSIKKYKSKLVITTTPCEENLQERKVERVLVLIAVVVKNFKIFYQWSIS
tara:strand:- start:194 stop:415 length:222 start_codon:yes stop_codon:yes gene_type:complete